MKLSTVTLWSIAAMLFVVMAGCAAKPAQKPVPPDNVIDHAKTLSNIRGGVSGAREDIRRAMEDLTR